MKLLIPKGTTSKRVGIFIQDSSSTVGAGLAGLTNASAGLKWSYWRESDGNAGMTAVTLAAATLGTFTSGGFKEKDATLGPGWYEIGIPDAALASGANWCEMHLLGAANMAPLPIEIQLTGVDLGDAVRGGMTALPNAAAEAAGGLYTRGAGAGQINQDANGRIDANAKAWIGGAIPAVNVAGVPLVDVKYFLGTAITEGGAGRIAARFTGVYDAASSGYSAATAMSTYAGGAVASVTAAVTVGTNNDKGGYGLSAAAIQAIWDALTSALTTVGSIGKWILDKLDVVLSTRLATSGYTAPDNASIATILTRTDVATSSRLAAGDIVEGTVTWVQAARGWNAAMLGKADGLAGTTAHYRDQADAKNRITATVDANGNRTAVTLDLT